MALFCTRHREGPLDVWYDCDACCQEDNKEESVKHIRKMTCADHKALRICRSGEESGSNLHQNPTPLTIVDPYGPKTFSTRPAHGAIS